MSRFGAERIDRMPKTARSKLYYAVGLLSCAIASLLHGYGPVPLLAFVVLAVAAAFLFDRLCAEIRLWRAERLAAAPVTRRKPRS